MMLTTSGFIQLRCADNDNWIIIFRGLAVDQSLGAGGFVTADHADGMEFIDALSFGQNQWHGAKRFAAEVHIQAGDDHTDSA